MSELRATEEVIESLLKKKISRRGLLMGGVKAGVGTVTSRFLGGGIVLSQPTEEPNNESPFVQYEDTPSFESEKPLAFIISEKANKIIYDKAKNKYADGSDWKEFVVLPTGLKQGTVEVGFGGEHGMADRFATGFVTECNPINGTIVIVTSTHVPMGDNSRNPKEANFPKITLRRRQLNEHQEVVFQSGECDYGLGYDTSSTSDVSVIVIKADKIPSYPDKTLPIGKYQPKLGDELQTLQLPSVLYNEPIPYFVDKLVVNNGQSGVYSQDYPDTILCKDNVASGNASGSPVIKGGKLVGVLIGIQVTGEKIDGVLVELVGGKYERLLKMAKDNLKPR